MTSSLRSASIAPVPAGGNPFALGVAVSNANTNPNSNLPWRVGD